MEVPARPDGPAAAAVVAAGVGIFVMGLLTALAAMSEPMTNFLTAFQGTTEVGPLAGESILAVATWLVSWAILGVRWWRRDADLRRSFTVALVLGILGVAGTFPMFDALGR